MQTSQCFFGAYCDRKNESNSTRFSRRQEVHRYFPRPMAGYVLAYYEEMDYGA